MSLWRKKKHHNQIRWNFWPYTFIWKNFCRVLARHTHSHTVETRDSRNQSIKSVLKLMWLLHFRHSFSGQTSRKVGIMALNYIGGGGKARKSCFSDSKYKYLSETWSVCMCVRARAVNYTYGTRVRNQTVNFLRIMSRCSMVGSKSRSP